MTIAAPAPCTEQAKKEGELTAARRQVTVPATERQPMTSSLRFE
jgi:hypothetical protein